RPRRLLLPARGPVGQTLLPGPIARRTSAELGGFLLQRPGLEQGLGPADVPSALLEVSHAGQPPLEEPGGDHRAWPLPGRRPRLVAPRSAGSARRCVPPGRGRGETPRRYAPRVGHAAPRPGPPAAPGRRPAPDARARRPATVHPPSGQPTVPCARAHPAPRRPARRSPGPARGAPASAGRAGAGA